MTKKQDIQKVTSGLTRLKPENRAYMGFLVQSMLLIQTPGEAPVSGETKLTREQRDTALLPALQGVYAESEEV